MDQSNIKHFISYRRKGGDVYARTIYQQLLLDGYDKDTVFFDIHSSDGFFSEEIQEAIENCENFILVLTEHTLDKCSDPEDWVRKEIVYAMKLGKNIIPVGINKWSQARPDIKRFFTRSDDLPEEIARIKELKLIWLSMDEGFENAIKEIENKFGRILKSARKEEKEVQTPLGILKKAVADSATKLGKAYYFGEEADQDYQKALAFYHAGALAGNSYAQYCYGFMLIYNGFCQDDDYEEAVHWLEMAAEKNETNAMAELGALYYYGRYVEKDYDRSNAWYQKGAEKGDSECLLYLGMNYLYGNGKQVDPQKALDLFEQAKESAPEGDEIIKRIDIYIERAKKRL